MFVMRTLFYPGLATAAVVAALAGVVNVPLAHADIYTWTDAKGRVNISNLDPPEGVRVTNVVHETAPDPAAAAEARRAAARDAEMAALSERVRDLQVEVEVNKRLAAMADNRAAYQSPPSVQYVADSAPAQYAPDVAPQYAYGYN